ncbi:hypothetical protein RF11_04105 [Thelohanellus kitauei]|uniref:Uncharacterized protein n=1 Tax=Thelohanellus kitauei TaxID=669202 RepID=A0A0C2J9L1_THEKT|nr:hypothetical protein RF11_04105 [Thelohanellus kitauei]
MHTLSTFLSIVLITEIIYSPPITFRKIKEKQWITPFTTKLTCFKDVQIVLKAEVGFGSLVNNEIKNFKSDDFTGVIFTPQEVLKFRFGKQKEKKFWVEFSTREDKDKIYVKVVKFSVGVDPRNVVSAFYKTSFEIPKQTKIHQLNNLYIELNDDKTGNIIIVDLKAVTLNVKRLIPLSSRT